MGRAQSLPTVVWVCQRTAGILGVMAHLHTSGYAPEAKCKSHPSVFQAVTSYHVKPKLILYILQAGVHIDIIRKKDIVFKKTKYKKLA